MARVKARPPRSKKCVKTNAGILKGVCKPTIGALMNTVLGPKREDGPAGNWLFNDGTELFFNDDTLFEFNN